ncbi:hypothetical protein HaLaN_28625, partial [Haematococcus lacustris]
MTTCNALPGQELSEPPPIGIAPTGSASKREDGPAHARTEGGPLGGELLPVRPMPRGGHRPVGLQRRLLAEQRTPVLHHVQHDEEFLEP